MPVGATAPTAANLGAQSGLANPCHSADTLPRRRGIAGSGAAAFLVSREMAREEGATSARRRHGWRSVIQTEWSPRIGKKKYGCTGSRIFP